MSIIVSDLSFHYPNQHPLFSHLNFSVSNREKISLIGDNGMGKSTLLKLLAGQLDPATGSIISSSAPYYIPQNASVASKSVAEVLGIDAKLKALRAIENGSLLQEDYDTLNDDWDIESRCESALAYWNLSGIPLDTVITDLSGGEKAKVFLSGLLVHTPGIVLLDEPSNDLDRESRELLYQFIERCKATIVVVSHDVTLLNQLSTTYELSKQEIRRYGGNYFFYKEQRDLEANILENAIRVEERNLRSARKKAQEVKEQQEKRLKRGEQDKTQVPRIFRKTLTNSSENTASRLGKKHAEIIDGSQDRLSELRSKKGASDTLKMDFEKGILHSGKLLIDAQNINYSYSLNTSLWKDPLDFRLYSNDRVHIEGNNGTGKTSLLQLLTGELSPSSGMIKRADFTWIYLDQNYAQVDLNCSVEELAESYNFQKLKEHEIKLRLNRFLFPADSWDKNCKDLSGGEKMRLSLCCLMISNATPDLIILDEPTNNLDISSLQILVQTIRDYKGSLLVISHDDHFISEIGINSTYRLSGHAGLNY